MMQNFATAIVSKAAELLVEPIKNQIGYAFNYENNIHKLKEEVDLLKDAEVSVNHRVEEAATRHGEEIQAGVDRWLKRVRTATEEAGKVLEGEDRAKRRRLMGLCPDFKTRYQLSRTAEKHTQACVKLRGEGNFERVSYYRPPEHITAVKDYEDFESRRLVLEEIIEALTESDNNLIGVFGMSGVGKTKLVAKLAEQVKEDRLFEVVIKATVTQNADPRRIQGEIADGLDFSLDGVESVCGRADRLRQRMNNKKKTLVILDDIWERIDLAELGIPHGNDHKGCKILMTSRNQSVLSGKMGTEKEFRLQVLEDDESWKLFEKILGDIPNYPSFQAIAREVANRCAGLPILIVAVARALRNKNFYAWKDALEQLKRFDGDDIEQQVFLALELSYNFLRGNEIKSLFLLCGQLNSNVIHIHVLFKYILGLGLFKRSSTLEEVSYRLHTLLDELKASCLLLDGNNNGQVKMHDIVHSFAVSIASKDPHVFLRYNCDVFTEWPAHDLFEQCTAISLHFCRMLTLPEVLECPHLEFFFLGGADPSLRIPDNFFARTKKLKVLDLFNLHFSSLPSSLRFLQSLQTLFLDQCVLEDIVLIGELKMLQVLSFLGSNIVRHPREIEQLTNLRLLDLSHSQGLEVILPNVLSCLTRLEHLYMGNIFVQWGIKGSNSLENSNAKIAELKLLSNLSNLQIHITDAKMLPKDLFPGKLESFCVVIGEGWDWSGTCVTSRMLKLKLNSSIQLDGGIIALLERTEDLYFDNLMGVENILYDLDAQGFPQLKHLHILNSHEIRYVINSVRMDACDAFPRLESLFLTNLNSLEAICLGQLVTNSFSNLKKLEVENCGRMRNLFSFSMAKGLLQLEQIKVTECENMDVIIAQESEQVAQHGEPVKLTHLRRLKLEYLPQLTSICFQVESNSPFQTRQNMRRHGETEPGSELGRSIPLFNNRVEFPNLEELRLSSKKMEKIWCDQLVESCFYVKKLTVLIVKGCENLKHLLTPSVVENLAQLKQLAIYDCKFMEEIIMTKGLGGEMMSKVLFPKLAWLVLKNLSELKWFCIVDLIECPSWKRLVIENCPKLKAFISNSSSRDVELDVANSTLFDEKVSFPNVERLEICHMPKLTTIWHAQLRQDSFLKLRSLELIRNRDLLKIFPSTILRRFQDLENLTVAECNSLEEVFDLSNARETQVVATTKLRNLILIGLPNLKCIWNQDPCGILNFKNLRSMETLNCPNLKCLFAVSIARSLSHLEELDIGNCNALEEIIAKEDGVEDAPRFNFPRLKHLRLQILPELRSFYPGMHTLECPVLEALRVYHCHRLHTFASEPHNLQETNMKNQLAFQVHQQPLLSFRKAISKLKLLSLNRNDITMICQGHFPTGFFDKIEILHLCCFHEELVTNFPFDCLRNFQNMEKLVVVNCFFEALFPYGINGREIYTRSLSQIKSLELRHLPKMRHIWNQDSSSYQFLPNLTTLEVTECYSLINLAPSSVSFQTLTALEIWFCNGLINLVTSSTAKTPIQLTKMKVEACDELKEIVIDEAGDAENEITFSKLESLTLCGLRNLTSFYSGRCSIKFPSLEEVVVEECHKMKIFFQGNLSTPELKIVWLTTERDRERWKGDLNVTVAQLYNDVNAQQPGER